MKKPKYKVFFDAGHNCDLLDYADSYEEAEMIGKDWLCEAECFATEDNPNYFDENEKFGYYIDELTEDEASEVVRNDFIQRFERHFNDGIDEIWNNFFDSNKDHGGMKLVGERKIKFIASQIIRDYFDGWTDVILGEDEKQDSFESESSTWTGADGMP